VVVVDDVQWADPSTRGLLDHLRAGLDEVPVAIVTFTRTDEGDGVAPPAPGVEVVTLGPLDDSAAAGLARSVASSASDAAIAGVVARAAGNPFFIAELARELGDHESSTLPPSIEAIVQARLDHLPEAAGQVALAAAVVGRAFTRSAVASVVGLDGEALDAALAELERRGLVTALAPVTVDDDRYQFAQGLVRDVAYGRIPSRERRQLHAAVAAWLDARAARAGSDSLQPGPWTASGGGPTAAPSDRERKEDIALVLDAAYHREQAGDTAGAAAAYRRAGARCLAVFAYGEAATALRRAAALASGAGGGASVSVDERLGGRAEAVVGGADAPLHEDLGDALAETAGPAAAEAAYRDAVGALRPDDTAGAARLQYKLGLCASRKGDPNGAIARYRAGLAHALPDGDALAPWAQQDPRVAAQLLGGLGWTLGYQLGRVDEGHPLCERAVALLDGTMHRRELAHALSRLGGTYMRACRFADQLRTNERNLEIGRELADLTMQLTANINLGVVHGLLGDIAAAVAATASARAIAQRIGAAATAGLAASNLAGLLIEQGKLAAAEEAIDEALDLIDRTGHRYVLCETYIFAARLAAARGDLAAARHHAERSRALARELASAIDGAVATRILAQLAARTGDHAAARALIDEAVAAAAAADAFEAARTRAARARILLAAGDAGADAAMADARAELTRLGAKRELEVLGDVNEVR
jgi:tetratricopeptide (TPR) repeat protein